MGTYQSILVTGATGYIGRHVVGTGLHGDLFIDVDNSYRKYLKHPK